MLVLIEWYSNYCIMWEIKIKKVEKFFAWTGGGVVTVFLLAWAGFFVWNRFDEVRIVTEVERTLAAHDAEEIEVGETPQETFAFFLDALRDNDLDLAAKYFAPEVRRGWRMHLQNIKDKQLLDGMIADLENMEEDAPLSTDHFREMSGQWRLVAL